MGFSIFLQAAGKLEQAPIAVRFISWHKLNKKLIILVLTEFQIANQCVPQETSTPPLSAELRPKPAKSEPEKPDPPQPEEESIPAPNTELEKLISPEKAVVDPDIEAFIDVPLNYLLFIVLNIVLINDLFSF